MFWFGLVVGAVLGGALIGFLANKKPSWFANVVKAANAVDSSVNAGAAAVAQKVANK